MEPVNITVSIVEDDAPARGILAEWIRGADSFKCVGVHGNAEVALAALPQENPSVVLMDINMPGMSGIECVRRLKPQMMDTQFMMLTVYEDPDHIFKALSSGASGYLLKRTPRAELLAAVKDVHAGGSPMSSNIARKMSSRFSGSTAPRPPSRTTFRRANAKFWNSSRADISTRKSPRRCTSACRRSTRTSAAFTKNCTSARARRPSPSSRTSPTQPFNLPESRGARSLTKKGSSSELFHVESPGKLVSARHDLSSNTIDSRII